MKMTYFWVKRLWLGAAYEGFLKRSLAPGGTIFVMECNLQWPTTRYGARHLFQFGALGGATPEEYLHGGPRVEDYLSRYHSLRRCWEPPPPDGERPEAEWGFEPALREDVERLAREQGYRIRRIVFDTPEQLSPLVADLYRGWYGKRGITDHRLLVESFIVMEPYWAIRGGLVLRYPHEFYSDRQWFWISSSRQLMAASRSANRKVSRGSSMTLRPMKIVESTMRSRTVLT